MSEVSHAIKLSCLSCLQLVNVLLQVKSNFRTAITVPEKCWTRFRDILNDYCEKMSETATTTADNNSQAAPSSAPASAGGSQK